MNSCQRARWYLSGVVSGAKRTGSEGLVLQAGEYGTSAVARSMVVLSRFLEQPVQVIYLLIFYVNIFHHINIGGKSLYISHII